MISHDGPALANYSIKHLSEGIKTGKILPTELIEVSLDRIKVMNSTLNAFITVIREDELYKQAQIAENEIHLGKYRGPLHGIRFSVKDIIYVSGITRTAGSKILYDFEKRILIETQVDRNRRATFEKSRRYSHRYKQYERICIRDYWHKSFLRNLQKSVGHVEDFRWI